MTKQPLFEWRHFPADIAVLCVRWYLLYSLSYRDLEEIMLERGQHVDHTTIYHRVQLYAPELEKRCQPYLKATNDSWRVDETSIKVKKEWLYLYRAVDFAGNTFEFLLSSTRDAEAAKRSSSSFLQHKCDVLPTSRRMKMAICERTTKGSRKGTIIFDWDTYPELFG